MRQAFFDFTVQYCDLLTNLLTTIHAISISFWNMKSEIAGIKALYDKVTEKELDKCFNISNSTTGVNYKFFSQTEFADFQERLAWILLVDACSIFEGFIAKLSEQIGIKCKKNLEFPSEARNVIEHYKSQDKLLLNCFYKSRKKVKEYPTASLEDLLKCYRYFKEIRNCYTHNAAYADDKLIEAYKDFIPVNKKSALGLDSALKISVITEDKKNERISINLYGVIGFTNILIKLIYMYDTEFMCTNGGLEYFSQKIKKSVKEKVNLSSNAERRKQKIASICKAAGFWKPDDEEAMLNYLKKNNLVIS